MKADRSGFEIIESKVAVVRHIFDESAAGIGAYTILRRLNREKVPHLSGIDGWTSSYVCKLLKNRAVLGEFQTYKYLKKMPGEPRRRRPDGEPVPGYFPAIIDEDVFDRVQAGLWSRRGRGGRKGGKFLRNIFSILARCEYCQSPMKFEHKGDGRGGGGYLVCDHAGRGVECKRTGWKYHDFESSFLSFVKEMDLTAVIDSESENSNRRAMENQIVVLRGKLASVENERDRAYELYMKSGQASDFVGEKLNGLEARRTELVGAIKAKEDELAGVERVRIAAQDFRPIIERVQGSDGGDEAYKLRSMVASRLRSLVKAIYIGPLGTRPLMERLIEYVGNTRGTKKLIEQFKSMAHDERHFIVMFADGSRRWVFPSNDDPLKVTHQIVGDADATRWLDPSGEAIRTLRMPRAPAPGA